MSAVPNYTAMDSGALLAALADDGAKWAAAFCQTAKKVQGIDLDEDWMIGWFANAIESSHALRKQREAERVDEPCEGCLTPTARVSPRLCDQCILQGQGDLS